MGLAERAEVWAGSQDSVDSMKQKKNGDLGWENKGFLRPIWKGFEQYEKEAFRSPEFSVKTVVIQCLGILPLPWNMHRPPGPKTGSHNKMSFWRCSSERPGEGVGNLPSRDYKVGTRWPTPSLIGALITHDSC